MESNNTLEIINTGVSSTPVIVKKKRGRKPNPNKPKMYFSDREEDAFREYLLTEDIYKKNKIFNDILYPAFSKMVESIIRKYTLFKPGEEFEDTFNDVMSHLISKVEKFDVTKNKKAYSYCGTICKNYALHERQKAQEKLKSDVSYEVIYNDINPDLRATTENPLDEDNLQYKLMGKSASMISKMITEPQKFGLNDNDIKVGIALVDILMNWGDIFSQLETKKYNKSQIDLFIKEFTSLGTKQIRDAKKKFSNVYFKMKNEILKNH